jgi:hypothetical protein
MRVDHTNFFQVDIKTYFFIYGVDKYWVLLAVVVKE